MPGKTDMMKLSSELRTAANSFTPGCSARMDWHGEGGMLLIIMTHRTSAARAESEITDQKAIATPFARDG